MLTTLYRSLLALLSPFVWVPGRTLDIESTHFTKNSSQNTVSNSPGQESNLRTNGGPSAAAPEERNRTEQNRTKHNTTTTKKHETHETRRCARLKCGQISWSRAESQQIAVRWLLYCLRHPDRELSRLQMISHLHAQMG